MKINLTSVMTKCWKNIAVIMVLLISACGGGNGSPGSPMGGGEIVVPATGSITLSLRDKTGKATNNIPFATDTYLNVTALVTNSNDESVGTGTVVTFTVDGNAGFIDPIFSTAITDNQGNAHTVLQSGTPGVGKITATATLESGEVVSETTGFCNGSSC